MSFLALIGFFIVGAILFTVFSAGFMFVFVALNFSDSKKTAWFGIGLMSASSYGVYKLFQYAPFSITIVAP